MFGDRKQLAVALVWLVCCDQPSPLAPAAPTASPPETAGQTAHTPDGSLTPTFIDADYRELYQTLLLNGLAAFEKSARWSRFYHQRWVRWTGLATNIKPDTILFRHLDATGTYDVLLKMARKPGQPPIQVSKGHFYNYVGRLERFDDGFQTFYLDQGVVFNAGPEGVPGTLTTEPQLTRQVADPPHVLLPLLHQ